MPGLLQEPGHDGRVDAARHGDDDTAWLIVLGGVHA